MDNFIFRNYPAEKKILKNTLVYNLPNNQLVLPYIPILWVMILHLRRFKWYVQSHTAFKCYGSDGRWKPFLPHCKTCDLPNYPGVFRSSLYWSNCIECKIWLHRTKDKLSMLINRDDTIIIFREFFEELCLNWLLQYRGMRYVLVNVV